MTQTLTALVQGFFLSISPCVLSILPIVLSGSLEKGRLRPFGIIAGLMGSFVIFSLFVGELFRATKISPDLLKIGASILILLFALSMIFSVFERRFESLSSSLANFGEKLRQLIDSQKHQQLANNDENRNAQKESNGLWSGLLLGACLGLIWTPCVGPLVLGAMTEAALQESILSNALVIISFCLGASIPMLAIAFFSQKLSRQIDFFKRHSIFFRKAAGYVMLLALLFGSGGQSILYAFEWIGHSVLGMDTQETYELKHYKTGCKLQT